MLFNLQILPVSAGACIARGSVLNEVIGRRAINGPPFAFSLAQALACDFLVHATGNHRLKPVPLQSCRGMNRDFNPRIFGVL